MGQTKEKNGSLINLFKIIGATVKQVYIFNDYLLVDINEKKTYFYVYS